MCPPKVTFWLLVLSCWHFHQRKKKTGLSCLVSIADTGAVSNLRSDLEHCSVMSVHSESLLEVNLRGGRWCNKTWIVSLKNVYVNLFSSGVIELRDLVVRDLQPMFATGAFFAQALNVSSASAENFSHLQLCLKSH